MLNRLPRIGRSILTTAAVCGLVWGLVGCTGDEGGDGRPTPRHWVYEAAELPAYAEEQRRELEQIASQRPRDVVRAALILARPLAPAEVQTMADDAGVRPLYFEWLQSGSELRCGDGWTHVWDRAAENAGLQVVYLTGDVEAAGWHSLAADARVWLVDVWGEDNLFDLAVEAGLVPKP